MRIVKSILILSVLLVGMAGCQKDGVGSKKDLIGTWVGKWGFDEDAPTYYEKWEIKKNGSMTAYNKSGNVVGEGFWKLDGLNFEAEYTPPGTNYNYSFFGLHHDALEEIIGTWGDTPSSMDRGTFEMYKD